MTDRPPPPSALSAEERDALAAELALGFLSDEEKAAALAMQRDDPVFAAEVARWSERAERMLDEVAPVPPPPQLWARIEAARSAGAVRPTLAAANDRGGVAPAWRFGALAAGLASFTFASLWAFNPREVIVPSVRTVERPLAAGEVTVVQIAGADQRQVLAAVYDRPSGRLLVRLGAVARPGLVPELWVIPSGGAPRSLGPAPADAAMTLTLTEEQRRLLIDGATIAVSLEQPSDRPHAAPAGEILGSAVLSKI